MEGFLEVRDMLHARPRLNPAAKTGFGLHRNKPGPKPLSTGERATDRELHN